MNHPLPTEFRCGQSMFADHTKDYSWMHVEPFTDLLGRQPTIQSLSYHPTPLTARRDELRSSYHRSRRWSNYRRNRSPWDLLHVDVSGCHDARDRTM